jgi:hypothetical protein
MAGAGATVRRFTSTIGAYWRFAVAAVIAALLPYVNRRIGDALVDAGFDWAWRRWQLPAVLADVWIWMEGTPVQAAALATLAWLVIAVGLTHRALTTQPDRRFWEEMEEAFSRIPTEVEAIGAQNTEGRVAWSVHPATKGEARDRDRFLSEARRAGAAVRKIHDLPRRYSTGEAEDTADDWLNVVTALIHFPIKIHGEGRDPDFGEYKTELFEEIVRASRDACRRIAYDDVEPPKPGPSISKPRKRGRALLWTPGGFIEPPTCSALKT